MPFAHEARFFDEASMIAGQKRMKLIDAIHYRTAVQAGCQFFLTHDHGIPSSDGMEEIRIGDFFGQPVKPPCKHPGMVAAPERNPLDIKCKR